MEAAVVVAAATTAKVFPLLPKTRITITTEDLDGTIMLFIRVTAAEVKDYMAYHPPPTLPPSRVPQPREFHMNFQSVLRPPLSFVH